VALGRDFSMLGADYTLAKRLAGPSRREVAWNGRQCWLFLPDRLLGLVELTPDGKQKSKAITLNIELGRGKTGAIDTSPARKPDDLTCQFGNLLVKVLDTNLKGIKISPKADGMAADAVRGPHNEFHLVDEPNLADWSNEQREYQGTYYALLELKPAAATAPAKVEKIQQGSQIGLRVEFNNCLYTTIYNSGEQAATIPSAPYRTAAKTTMFSDRATAAFTRPCPVPDVLDIPAKQGVLIVSSDDPRAHEPGHAGWPAFLRFFEDNTATFTPRP
jgi:hypothetical protein